MGLFDKLKEKGRGVMTAAKPEDGVEPQSADEVRDRLLAISGKGIQTGVEDGEIVVGRCASSSRDESDHEAEGIGTKATSEAELTIGGAFSGSLDWERGQHMGSESMHVIAWLGPHATERGADESGYKFSWSDLREPVIDAVTGAGWTYKPKKF